MPGSPALWARSFNQNIRTVPKIQKDCPITEKVEKGGILLEGNGRS